MKKHVCERTSLISLTSLQYKCTMKKNPLLFFAFPVFYFLLFFTSLHVQAQSIPPFRITLSDNNIFNGSDVPKGKPMILIYFDPECDHCQKLMDELFKNVDSLKKAEIVMVTYKPVIELPAFEAKYDTHRYTNIKVGTEGTGFYLRRFYGLVIMPFTALYDKEGNLNYSYKSGTPIHDLIGRLKKLK